MDELDELEPELRALLEAERDAPLPGMAAAKARGLAALLAEAEAPGVDRDAKGGDAKGGDAKDGDAKDGDAKDGDAKDGDAKGADAKDGDDAKDADAKGDEPTDGDAKDGEASPGSDVKGSDAGASVGDAGAKAGAAVKAGVAAKTLVATALLSGALGGALGAGVTWALMKDAPAEGGVEVRTPEHEAPARDAAATRVDAALAADAGEESRGGAVERGASTEPRGRRETRPGPSGAAAPERGVLESSEAASPSRLARERALIDQARAALRAGRAHDALVALMGHEREFPTGAFAEDRERLAIEGLVRTDRSVAARRRAEAFLARYPDSAHRARVRRFLDELPPP
ncbi:MAG TPA: hypothetical protein RMH85_33650 [Polyangiaceae bacterium LLY-WYZ-15_(1-7)]|nr:hypothetical protein [Polyangiaceae bacterium LLY-WYZ-15_(1-7)]